MHMGVGLLKGGGIMGVGLHERWQGHGGGGA